VRIRRSRGLPPRIRLTNTSLGDRVRALEAEVSVHSVLLAHRSEAEAIIAQAKASWPRHLHLVDDR